MNIKPLSPAKTVFAMKSLYLLFWAAVFITGQYMTIFLRDLSFTTDFMVGVIMSGGSLVATISQFIWGYVADHARTKNSILLTTIAGLLIGLFLLITPKHQGLLTLLPCYFFLFFFNTIPGMLIDTINVENIESLGASFGKVRVFASIGAAIGAFLLYLISLRITLSSTNVFIIAIIVGVTALVPASFLPATKGHAYKAKGEKNKTSYRVILQNPRMLLLLMFLLLTFIGVSMCNLFMGVYFATEAGLNAGLGMYGLFFAVCIGVEAFTMAFANRYLQRMNIYNVFTIVSIAAFSRALIIYASPNIYVMYLLALSQAMLFAPLWTHLTPYINSIVPMEMRATGQAAWSIMMSGVAPMIGSAMGGAIADVYGIRNLFGIVAVMLAAVGVVFYFLFRRQRKSFAGSEDD
ncbi:MAG: MFS transporter [Clostridiales bacterium]|nr:MFS transporter [Clostridiales bacterium]